MYTQKEKRKENTSRAVANSVGQKKSLKSTKAMHIKAFQWVDNNKIRTKEVYQFQSISNTDVIQMAKWKWDGQKWVSQDGSSGAGPRRRGAYKGETVDYEEPKHPISLNLGAGQNPMMGLGVINLEYDEKAALAGKKTEKDEYVIADATKLPFRSGVFDLIHAINPYGFYPVNGETGRVLSPLGVLRVTGNFSNKFVKNSGKDHVDPSSVGLQEVGISDMAIEHQFGTQSHTGGLVDIVTSSSKTKSYGKVDTTNTPITLLEASNSDK